MIISCISPVRNTTFSSRVTQLMHLRAKSDYSNHAGCAGKRAARCLGVTRPPGPPRRQRCLWSQRSSRCTLSKKTYTMPEEACVMSKEPYVECSFFIHSHAHTRMQMRACIHTCMHTDQHTLTRIYAYTNICTYTHTHTHTHTHIPTYTHAHIHTYTHTQIHTHIHIHTYTYTHIHTYIHTCTYTHIHTYTYTHIHTRYPESNT